MGQNKILDLFFEEPTRLFQIREISRLTRIPKSTVERKLKKLSEDKLIVKNKKNVVGYMANEAVPYFRLVKKVKFLKMIYKSGLIDYLEKLVYPRCIILFGSFSKGEYNKESDIDIFVQSKEKNYDVTKFEKRLKHTINLFFDEKLSNLSKELFNNIINGIKLAGYIKLK